MGRTGGNSVEGCKTASVFGKNGTVRAENAAARGKNVAVQDEVVAARYEIVAVQGEVVAARAKIVAVQGEVVSARAENVAVRGEVVAARCENVAARCDFQTGVPNVRGSVVGASVPASPSGVQRSVPKPTRSVIVGADQGFSGVQKSDCWGSEKRFLRGNKAFFPLRKFPFDCRSPRHPTFHLLK